MSNLTLFGYGPLPWIDVILLGWFALTALSVAYVAWDAITNNPEMTVMKWGWVLVTLYLGPISLFLYIMSCKEPYPGTHDEFIKPLWKQGLDSAIPALPATPRVNRRYHHHQCAGATHVAGYDHRVYRRHCRILSNVANIKIRWTCPHF